MTKSTQLFGALAMVLTVAGSGSVHAQLIDQMMSSSIGAGTELGSAARAQATPEAITKNLQMQGFTNITPEGAGSNGSVQYSAMAPGGMKMQIMVDPLTGKMVSATPQQ